MDKLNPNRPVEGPLLLIALFIQIRIELLAKVATGHEQSLDLSFSNDLTPEPVSST